MGGAGVVSGLSYDSNYDYLLFFDVGAQSHIANRTLKLCHILAWLLQICTACPIGADRRNRGCYAALHSAFFKPFSELAGTHPTWPQLVTVGGLLVTADIGFNLSIGRTKRVESQISSSEREVKASVHVTNHITSVEDFIVN